MWIFFGVLIAVAIVGSIVGSIYQIISGIIGYFFEDTFNRLLPFTSLELDYRQVLEKDFRYYQTLSDRNKRIFEKRVKKFINQKEFIPKGELKIVTVQMEALIAASAVQITFGLPSIYLTQFDKIIVSGCVLFYN